MYFIQIARKERGPYSLDQLEAFLESGQINQHTHVRGASESRWVQLAAHPDWGAPIEAEVEGEAEVDAAPADRRVTALALPIAVLLILLLDVTGIARWVPLINMGLHELGHSMTGWLGARFMLPLPYISTSGDPISSSVFLLLSAVMAYAGFRKDALWLQYLGGVLAAFFGSWFFFDGRNPVIFLLLTAGAGVLVVSGLWGRSALLIWLGVGLVLLQVFFTFLIGEDLYNTAFFFNGIAGEFLLGTLLTVSFYYAMPPLMRWESTRFLALLPGVFALTTNTLSWWRYANDPETLPLGTAIGGRGDSGGDLNHLLNDAAWSVDTLTGNYLTLAALCWLVVLGHYGYGLWRR